MFGGEVWQSWWLVVWQGGGGKLVGQGRGWASCEGGVGKGLELETLHPVESNPQW
jgi:hypothetical protein